MNKDIITTIYGDSSIHFDRMIRKENFGQKRRMMKRDKESRQSAIAKLSNSETGRKICKPLVAVRTQVTRPPKIHPKGHQWRFFDMLLLDEGIRLFPQVSPRKAVRGSHSAIKARACFKALDHKIERREAKVLVSKELSELATWKQEEDEKRLMSERREMLEDIIFHYIDSEYYDVVRNVVSRFDHFSEDFNISDVLLAVNIAIKNEREKGRRLFNEEVRAFDQVCDDCSVYDDYLDDDFDDDLDDDFDDDLEDLDDLI